MTDPLVGTVGYYDRCAADLAAQTADLDLEPVYLRFLRYMPPGGRILDAGCGAGRDGLAFAERGYEVVAFDASEAMVKLASERVGNRAIVHLMTFQELNWQHEFDGIWACAPLKHVPQTSFIDVVARLASALPRRWVVERTFAWLNRCRRLAKDFENRTRNALAFIRLASIRLMLRKLSNSNG